MQPDPNCLTTSRTIFFVSTAFLSSAEEGACALSAAKIFCNASSGSVSPSGGEFVSKAGVVSSVGGRDVRAVDQNDSLLRSVLVTGAGPESEPLDESGVDVPDVVGEPEADNDVVEALEAGIGMGSDAKVTRGSEFARTGAGVCGIGVRSGTSSAGVSGPRVGRGVRGCLRVSRPLSTVFA